MINYNYEFMMAWIRRKKYTIPNYIISMEIIYIIYFENIKNNYKLGLWVSVYWHTETLLLYRIIKLTWK